MIINFGPQAVWGYMAAFKHGEPVVAGCRVKRLTVKPKSQGGYGNTVPSLAGNGFEGVTTKGNGLNGNRRPMNPVLLR